MAPRKSALWSQIWTLSHKNWTISIERHMLLTLYTAFLLPLILSAYLGIGQRLNSPSSEFGISEPRSVRSLSDALGKADSSRDTVLFVNNGLEGGDIESVIDDLSEQVRNVGKNATTISNARDVGYVCRPSYQGVTNCFGAVVFNSSPDEGESGVWNYTLRADLLLGRDYEYKKDSNDAQVYTLPLQRAVDAAIAKNSGEETSLDDTEELSFTDETENERKKRTRREYQNTFIDYLAVAWVLALVGITYHLPGTIATERETGLSQLIDAMMSNRHDWEPQVARLFSYVFSFACMYAPGWIVASLIGRFMIWSETNVGIVLVFFLLAGLAFTSQAVLGATFFKKAQLSGTVNALAHILLGVLAQAIPNPNTGVVAVLSFLFTPCNFVFFVKWMAYFEGDDKSPNMLKSSDRSNSSLPGIAFWIFLIVQFFAYPIIAAFLERSFHGVASDGRIIYKGGASETAPQDAVHIEGMTKVYQPGFFRRMFSFISKPRAPTVAVNNLTLTAKRGQILALLGANGSGKSTTLDAVAGISRFNNGSVRMDASGGIGIAPQKNVLWDDLTVLEHIELFNKLKSPYLLATNDEIDALVAAIGLEEKRKSLAKTLSGGQKRKLQLGMMLIGGSSVCCIDEVSSGIDPLSRRKIWDILLAERGRRTMILTTHFLDEADLLADNIAILSKGTLKAEGSSVELKDTLGAGYRVHVLHAKQVRDPPSINGVNRKISNSTIVYTASSSSLAADVIRALEASRIQYRLSSPTIEDVFLAVAEEVHSSSIENTRGTNGRGLHTIASDDTAVTSEKAVGEGKQGLELMSGRKIGFVKETGVLVRKRMTLFKTNWFPYVVGFLLPIIAAAAIQTLVANTEPTGCRPFESGEAATNEKFIEAIEDASFVAGPRSDFPTSFEDLLGDLMPGSGGGDSNSSFELSNTFGDMQNYIEENRKRVMPGGLWLGSDDQPPTILYRADDNGIYTGVITQNLLDSIRTNVSISTAFIPFDSPTSGSTFDTLLVAIFFSIAVGVFPAFFSLYPNQERRSGVRGLQYSSGVRSLPLWTAHLAFDYSLVFVAMLLAAIIFAVTSDVWYQPAYLVPVFILYGLASLLVGYVFSLFMKSQLATWAAVAVYQSVGFAIYLIAFLYIITFSPSTVTDRNIQIGHYTIAAFFPVGSLMRSLMVGLNVFSTTCDGFELISYGGSINAYGAPILYLALQSLLCFSILLWVDNGAKMPMIFKGKKKAIPTTDNSETDREMANELTRVEADANKDGLQVKHLTKSFDSVTAVENVTFGVAHSEVFALLGPNGAGKSTTISMIRGDIAPSHNGGDVFVEQHSVNSNRAAARANMGVCPQFDAVDSMTVLEHLRHYARIRGIPDTETQVAAVVKAVGLEAYTDTMAEHLSGGNKRKLSLGIALTGNPSVILLDEPSSGLDAAAKRIMWRTLQNIVPGRSILLTTHSMEEADALATRAGILARRMLAVGEVDELQSRFGDSLYVHLVSRTAPHSTREEMERMSAWVLQMFPGAKIDSSTYHGQMRFSLPASAVLERSRATQNRSRHPSDLQTSGTEANQSAMGQLVVMLEENKEALGIAHHSVNPTTLNEVFLAIVGRHNVQEEGYGAQKKKKSWRKLILGF